MALGRSKSLTDPAEQRLQAQGAPGWEGQTVGFPEGAALWDSLVPGTNSSEAYLGLGHRQSPEVELSRTRAQAQNER